MHISRSFLLLLAAGSLAAQGTSNGSAAPQEKEPGIPVTHQTTVAKCGGCHRADKDGNLTRISWIRTTPEGWQQAIKRMVRLNGLSMSPAEAKDILHYLATNHGLAPEESAPTQWYFEKRMPEAEVIPVEDLREGCAGCHPLARPQSWFRSNNEWKELVNMHVGYFPVAEFISLRRRPRPRDPASATPPPTAPSAQPAPPQRDPADIAVEYFSRVNQLNSPAWASWRASMKPPKLAGKWLVYATQPGKGKFVGEMTIESVTPDEFTTTATLTSLTNGAKQTLKGKTVVYTGYAWRGRSASSSLPDVRQVMAVSRDGKTVEGRWFWGDYQEFGFNVTLRRTSADPTVLSTDISALKTGSSEAKVKIYGDHFPSDVAPADIDFGAGVAVKKVLQKSPSVLEVAVDVDPKAVSGARDVTVKGATASKVLAVYDRIDYIKISTDSMLARLGGAKYKKGYAQFEAIAYTRGLDGKPNTADDVALGPVPVTWSVEEFYAHMNDDDKDFVGQLDDNGLFTPALEGPNPKRKFSADNFGDVWVVATYKPAGASKPLTAKSYLVVTVPAYVRWDQPEVAE